MGKKNVVGKTAEVVLTTVGIVVGIMMGMVAEILVEMMVEILVEMMAEILVGILDGIAKWDDDNEKAKAECTLAQKHWLEK